MPDNDDTPQPPSGEQPSEERPWERPRPPADASTPDATPPGSADGGPPGAGTLPTGATPTGAGSASGGPVADAGDTPDSSTGAPVTADGEIIPSAVAPAARGGIPKAAIVGAIVAVLLAGGAVALVKTLGPQAPSDIATVVPSDAIGFLRVSIEPSGTQRDALRGLMRKLPEERRAQVLTTFDRALSSMLDGGENFQRDVKPWLGPQIGFAAIASGDDPVFVGAIGVEDEEAARRFFTRNAADADSAYLIEGNVAYVADEAAHITAFRTAAAKATLDANAAYRRELAAAGGDGLAVLWLNGEQIRRFADEIAGALGSLQSIPGLDASSGSAIFVLRAEENGLAFVGHQSGGPETKAKPGRPRLLEAAPSSVLGAFSVFDLKGSFAQLQQSGAQNPIAGLTPLLSAVGLDLEDDVLAWLGGEVTFVATPLMEFGLIAQLTDEAAYERTVSALLPALESGLGAQVTQEANGFTVVTEDGTVTVRRASGRVAFGFAEGSSGSRSLAQRLLAGGGATLGAHAPYRAVLGAPSDRTVFQAYLNVGALAPFVQDSDALAFIETFSAFAMRVTLSDGGSEIRLVLTLD